MSGGAFASEILEAWTVGEVMMHSVVADESASDFIYRQESLSRRNCQFRKEIVEEFTEDVPFHGSC